MKILYRRGRDGVVRRQCFSTKTGRRVKCPSVSRPKYEYRQGRRRKIGAKKWFCRPLPKRCGG